MTIETVEQLRDFVVKMTLSGVTVTYPSPICQLVQALTFALGEIERLKGEVDAITFAAKSTIAEHSKIITRLEKDNEVLQGYRNKSAEQCGRPFGDCIVLQAELNRIKNIDVEGLAKVIEKDIDTVPMVDASQGRIREIRAQKIAQAVKDFIVGGQGE